MTPEALQPSTEPIYTTEDLAETYKLHRETIRRLFIDEPGVIRMGHSAWRNKRQRFTLRIPRSVADRVFSRMKVQNNAA